MARLAKSKSTGSLVARTCTKCHRFLMASEFYPYAGCVGGRTAYCRQCHSASGKSSSNAYRAARRAQGLRPQRSKQHGMSDKEFLAFMAKGRCDACGSTETGTSHGWHVDHDHSCCPGSFGCRNCVRGLLCHPCNVTLGFHRDDEARLLALVDYIRATKELMGMSANGN